MPYPHFCIACMSKEHVCNDKYSRSALLWENTFSSDDYGFETDGIIGVYSCMHEDCNANYDIIDFYIGIDKNEIIRVIRYCYLFDEEHSSNTEKKMISHCLYCADKLVEISQTSSSKIKTPLYDCDGTETLLQCPNCSIKYNIIDFLSSEDELYISRDIFIS